VPPAATELLDLAGRWARERSPQRQPFAVGARVRDNRRGRTGADATLLLIAGTPGFGFRTGRAWGVHVAWSGNHRTLAERLSTGEAVLAGGELLLPGEVTLQPGQEYASPAMFASFGHGLDEVSGRFHRYLRDRRRPRRRPRPVVINTWEAVEFDHDLDRLKRLAEAGARVGAERFVLDDGWFRNRRDDRAGLGDWYVDEKVFPDGLHPLVNHVRSLGMQFGLWVEPEMINLDSDLARAHPDWILATGGRTPPASRHQQVLNVVHPDAFAYLFERLDALIAEYRIDYLKWDHNRDLVDAGLPPVGRAGVHEQTLAVYRLLDRLREAHPDLEIESCSSGGARVDLGILERTDRVWASDTIDAHERQFIQRWTELLLPPELIGSHVGAPRSVTTGRMHDLAFRAGTALFGDFGIEWDLTVASEDELGRLADWVTVYKQHRWLLHSGSVVRNDPGADGLWVHGVVAPDAGAALVAMVAVATAATGPVNRVTIPGLAPDAAYRVEPLPPGHQGSDPRYVGPWMLAGGATLTGRGLAEVGLQPPYLHPDQLLLLRLTRTDPNGGT
jgi:alpha-galactosidase